MSCPLCHGDPAAPVGMRWEVVIARKVSSQNKYNVRGNRFAYEGDKRKWQRDLLAAAYGAGTWKARCKRRIILTRILGPREMIYDHANLVGGCKPVIDAAKLMGLLVDDSPMWFEGYYHQDAANREDGPALRVVIEELVALATKEGNDDSSRGD